MSAGHQKCVQQGRIEISIPWWFWHKRQKGSFCGRNILLEEAEGRRSASHAVDAVVEQLCSVLTGEVPEDVLQLGAHDHGASGALNWLVWGLSFVIESGFVATSLFHSNTRRLVYPFAEFIASNKGVILITTFANHRKSLSPNPREEVKNEVDGRILMVTGEGENKALSGFNNAEWGCESSCWFHVVECENNMPEHPNG